MHEEELQGVLREQTPLQTDTQIVIYKECINRFEIYRRPPKPDRIALT